jgi:hypothetical protein
MENITKSKENSCTQFLPTLIDDLVSLLSNFIKNKEKYKYCYALTRNIAYSLQYLEYLNWIITSNNECLKQTGVLEKMTIKYFIITTAGIVERILYYLLCVHDLKTTTEWQSIRKTPTPNFKININQDSPEFFKLKNEILLKSENSESTEKWHSIAQKSTNEFKMTINQELDQTFKIENEIFFKLEEPKVTEMSLDQMIKKAESNNLLGNINETNLYKELTKLRKLRNKVHVRLIEDYTDTDWNTFALGAIAFGLKSRGFKSYLVKYRII